MTVTPKPWQAVQKQPQSPVSRAFISGGLARPIILLSQVLAIGLATRSLGAAAFALVATVLAFISIAGFLDFGIGNSLTNPLSAAFKEDSPEEVAQLVRMAFTTLTALGSAVLVVLLPIIWTVPIDRLFPSDALSSTEVRMTWTIFITSVAGGLPATLGSRIALAAGRGASNSKWLSGASVASLLSCFCFATLLPGSVAGIAFSLVTIPVATSSIQTLVWMRHVLSGLARIPLAARIGRRELLRGGFPYMLMSLISVATYQTDVLVISNCVSTRAAGDFALSARMFMILITLYGAGLQQLWATLAGHIHAQDGTTAWRLFRKTLLLTAGSSIPVAALLVVAGPSLTRAWGGATFHSSVWVLAVQACWSVYSLHASVFSFLLNAAGRLRAQVTSGLIMAVVSVPLSIILARNIGAPGPVLASLLLHSVIVMPVLLFNAIEIRKSLTDSQGTSGDSVSTTVRS